MERVAMSSPPTRRPTLRRWLDGATLIARTCQRATASFYNQRLGMLIPLFVALLLFSIVLIFLDSIAPLAPFVYSLI